MVDINNLGDATGGALIVESQSQKGTTSNTLDNILSDATQLPLDITITGNRTLTDDEFFLHVIFDLSGSPAGDFDLTLPATGEHWFIVRNNTGKVCTVDAGGTTVLLRESLSGLFHSDGTNVISTSDPDIMRYGTPAIDATADYLLFWDVSGGVLGRVLGDNLPGSSSAGTGAFPFSGAEVKLTGDLTTQNLSGGLVIGFDSEDKDIGGWHDNSVNNSRLTVPVGVKRVKITAQAVIGLATSNEWFQLNILKIGVNLTPTIITRNEISSSDHTGEIVSKALDVVPGDYFELELATETDTSVTVKSANTWFAIEAVETTESGTTSTVQTTDATQTVIATGAMAADSAHSIRAYGQGREDATGDTYHFDLLAGARNEGGTSTATTPNVRESTDAGASTWDMTLEANDTSDEWELKVTGEAAHTIDWTVTYFEIVQ